MCPHQHIMGLAPWPDVSVDKSMRVALLPGRKAVTWKGGLSFFVCLLTEHLIFY